jgi:LuxR family maltose regulon positive regulatory protein
MQLAALSIRGKTDFKQWSQSIAVGDQNLLEYFNQEVLSTLPVDQQRFIYSTAILDRLSGDLCNAVTGREDSQFLLEQLERENLFLTSLDPEHNWFQFHPLFRDLLARRLKQMALALDVVDLHRRAADWFEDHGWLDEAIPHALASRQYDQVARNLLRVGFNRILSGGAAVILSTCRAISEDWLDHQPQLLVLAAWALLALARFDQAEPFAIKAEAAIHSLPEGSPGRASITGQVAAIRATAAFNRREIERTVTLASTALELLPETERAIRSVVMLDLADALLMQGHLEPARQRYMETAWLAQQAGNVLVWINCLSMAGRVLSWQGRLHQAQFLYQQAVQVARDAGLEDLPVVGLAEDGLADLNLEWNHLDEARTWIEKSLHHFKMWGHAEHLLQAIMTEIEYLRAVGNLDEALAKINEAQQLVQQQQLSKSLRRVESANAILYWQKGQTDLALQTLLSAGLLVKTGQPDHAYIPPGQDPLGLIYAYPIGAKLLDELGDTSLALEWLERWLGQAQAAGYQRQVIRLLVVQAVIQFKRNDQETALEQIGRAIRLAEPEGLVRTFANEGEALVSLLQAWIEQDHGTQPCHAYSRRLLAVIHPQPEIVHSHEPPVPADGILSDREREVLRLAGAGLTNEEIARELIVSTNTIKTHLKRIFDKLGVNSRREAVQVARQKD